MTLCIAWKENNQIHFSSDSRATMGLTEFDHCVKVVSVPVKILGPINSADKYPDQIYEQNIGLCFAGSFLNAYTIKETLIHTLSSLQAIPGITDVSMDQICNLISKFYDFISQKLSQSLFDQGLAVLLVTGYCPKMNKVRTFKFSFQVNTHITTSYTEILLNNDEIEFVGSGSTKAKNIFKDLLSTPPLEVLKDVISDDAIKSVGGAIQYGEIHSRNFKVYGIIDFFVDESNKEIKTGFYYNGINLSGNPYSVNWDEFHLRQTYIDPFRNKINTLIDNGYNVI